MKPLALLVLAIIHVESGGDPHAISPIGARGLMQLMPATWADMSTRPWADAFDPAENVRAGTKYVRWIRRTLRRWTGTEPTVEQIAAAYNGGIGRLRRCKYDWHRMPRETIEYVQKVRKTIKRIERERHDRAKNRR